MPSCDESPKIIFLDDNATTIYTGQLSVLRRITWSHGLEIKRFPVQPTMHTSFATTSLPKKISQCLRRLRCLVAISIFSIVYGVMSAPLRADALDYENFDSDPGWDAHHNKLTAPTPRTVIQNFGYRPSNHAGSAAGEIGGIVDRSPLETASYAQLMSPRNLNQSLGFLVIFRSLNPRLPPVLPLPALSS